MSGRIGPRQPKVTHVHPLPESLNPAKHPEGKLKNDPKAGSLQREEGVGSSRSKSGSGGFDEILGLMGGGRFKNWEEFRKSQTLSKAERFGLALDKNTFVNAHLNPDIPSPEHAKTYWTKRPDFNHPLHADYVIARNAEYYTFRRSARSTTPNGTGKPDPAQATPPQKGTVLGSLSKTPKVALGGAATLMLGGMITAAVVVLGDSSSGVQGEAQA